MSFLEPMRNVHPLETERGPDAVPIRSLGAGLHICTSCAIHPRRAADA
jgi:hypothetical protein